MASKRLETAKRYINHFATLDKQVLDSLLADDFVHQFAPSSFDSLEAFDKQGMLDHYSRLHPILHGFPLTAKEYIESESSNQVTVWATSQTKFRDEVKDGGIASEDWLFEGEYIFLLRMDESGERITRTVEFVDSKATVDRLMVLMKRAKENSERGTQARAN